MTYESDVNHGAQSLRVALEREKKLWSQVCLLLSRFNIYTITDRRCPAVIIINWTFCLLSRQIGGRPSPLPPTACPKWRNSSKFRSIISDHRSRRDIQSIYKFASESNFGLVRIMGWRCLDLMSRIELSSVLVIHQFSSPVSSVIHQFKN